MTVTAAFREAMASLASAVYVVTGRDDLGRPRGFTATAVFPHTHEPPTVVVSIDRSAFSHDALVNGERFGLGILAPGQQTTAELFASKRPDKFDNVEWDSGLDGIPLLLDTAASAVLRVETVRFHGDHSIVVGRLEEADVRSETPLIYWRRAFSDGLPVHQPEHPQQRSVAMTATAHPQTDDLVARAEDLLPALRQRAQATEELRNLPGDTVRDLREAGFFRLFQPARYGGFEMDWGVQIEVSRVLGRACGSTAWITSVVATHSAMVGRFPGAAQDDVWGSDPDAIIATGSARTDGAARPVDGGYELSGGWRFASGIDHCQWVIVPAPVEGVDAEGPAALRQFLIPSGDFRIVDDWHVSGLRGTGSKKVEVEPVFVPEHRSIGFLQLLGVQPPGAAVNRSSVSRMEFGPYFGTILLGPILGAAEGALEDYLDQTRARIGAIFRNRIAESLPVQLRVAESSAEISAAGLMLDRMLAVMRKRAAADELLTPRERVEGMRDRTYLTRNCVDAVHRLVRQMGATGLSDDNPVQRHFRDLSAMSAQIGLNWDRNAGAFGKWALGIPTGDRAIDADLPAPSDDPSDSLA